MTEIERTIEYVLKHALKLKNQYFDGQPLNLDHVTIYSLDSKDYEKLNKEVSELGKEIVTKADGIFYELKKTIDIDDHKAKYIKVSEPEKDKLHKGSVSFVAPNFKEFAKDFNDVQNMNLIKEERLNKLEIIDHDFDVYVYVTSKSFSEASIDKKEKYDEETLSEEPIKEQEENELQTQLTEEKGKRLQLMADFQNYQKRVEDEKSKWGAIANLDLIKEMLEVHDDLQLALEDEHLNLEHAKASMKSAQDKLVAAAHSAGIEKVSVKVGDEFDKEKMEAVSTVPVKDEKHKNKVIAVISSAYKYKGKEHVLKPAKVVVGK